MCLFWHQIYYFFEKPIPVSFLCGMYFAIIEPKINDISAQFPVLYFIESMEEYISTQWYWPQVFLSWPQSQKRLLYSLQKFFVMFLLFCELISSCFVQRINFKFINLHCIITVLISLLSF